MRTKKIARNSLAEIIPYFIIGAIGFVKVRVLISCLGNTVNGYYEFINQIISYLFLVEAGFNSAVVYKLYKPFAEEDKEHIKQIFNGSRTIFRRIGAIIAALIFAASIVLLVIFHFSPNYVEPQYQLVVLATFLTISCSYLIAYFGKTTSYCSIFCADQRKWVYSLTMNIVKICCDLLIIAVIVIFKNLYALAIVILVVKVMEEIIVRTIGRKQYPWLTKTKKVDTSAASMTKDLIWHQLGFVAANNIDSIIIMSFMGPVMVSIYATYNYIFRFLTEMSSKANAAFIHSFGNVFAKHEEEKSYRMFGEYFVLYTLLAFAIGLTFHLGIRSFIQVWIGQDKYLLSYIVVAFFSLSLFLNIIYYPLTSMISANGLYHESRSYVMASAVINLILSIILVQFMGLVGVLLATCIAFTITIYLRSNLINKKVFIKWKQHHIFKRFLFAILIFIILLVVTYPLEKIFLDMHLSFIPCVIALGVIFLIVTLVAVSYTHLTLPTKRIV